MGSRGRSWISLGEHKAEGPERKWGQCLKRPATTSTRSRTPRSAPAAILYIGKGTGTRAYDHALRPDSTPKGTRIAEIAAEGREVLVTYLIDGLTEIQALKLEAELISSFGTEAAGGLLTNTIVPSGTGAGSSTRKSLNVPYGVIEKAQLGLTILKSSVLELAKANPNGIANSDVASGLRLRSDYGGGSKDYLSYSLLGLLMREGQVRREEGTKRHVAQVK